jgi:Flp pilus assembly pilin Flp
LISTPARFRAHRRSEHGAAVVEAALVISFVLIPLLVGVLTLGERLWRAQAVEPYNARVAPTQIVGHFTCAQLVDRVKQTVVDNSASLDTPVDISWVGVQVVEIVPTVGVLVEVSITVPAANEGGSPLVTEATSRLEHVTVSTESCL